MKYKNTKNIPYYIYGQGAINQLSEVLKNGDRIYFIDHFFKDKDLINELPLQDEDVIIYVDTTKEPTTEKIDEYKENLIKINKNTPSTIIGIGGGATLDSAKAVANLLTNPGKAEDYQGWDLVKNPAIYKVGIPTISGTGAEASRTCVMTNVKTGLKLGMNSDYTLYDQLILDPELTKTVPKEQYFFTGMDTYVHSFESLNGNYRHAVGDAFAREAISLCKQVFSSQDMMSDENREKLMTASYLGGCAIANSFVGVVHPFSAGLSVVFKIHHCEANCITMRGMKEFYPKEYDEFFEMAQKQDIKIPTLKKYVENLDEETFKKLYDSTIIHEKPLSNALGDNFKEILTYEKVKEVFLEMLKD